MAKIKLPYIALLINALAFSGCDIINPPEEIPAYIRVQEYAFNTDYSKEGSNKAKFEDIWITVDNRFIGAFEMPVTAPVLEKGTKKVLLRAGVLENGISTTRKWYPFLDPYIIDLELAETEIDTIKPVFKYSESTHFAWLEDFEGTSQSVQKSSRSKTDYIITTNPDSVYEGNVALVGMVDANNALFEVETFDNFGLPRNKAVWLELNYKNEVPLEVGFLSLGSLGTNRVFACGMNPSSEWKKIYINLSDLLAEEPETQVFKMYIAAFHQGTPGKILVDNIKLLYLE